MNEALIEQIATANEHELEEIRVRLLGKNGTITCALKELADLPHEQKIAKAKLLNEQKQHITELINNRKQVFIKIEKNTVDYTIPAKIALGNKHIITKSIEKLKQIFHIEGFEFVDGPDIESAYYNFEALNIPASHPARDNNDTFYIKNEFDKQEILLRTQTTAVQIRLLEKLQKEKIKKEIRSYSIGRVFRNDTHDATHSCSFFQIEGIIIEPCASMATLKGFMKALLENFFETEIEVTLRPSFFPFTTPSGELFMHMNGKTLEVGGCGMIHPDILSRYEQTELGFAFGLGLERLIMIKHKITSLQDLYSNHLPTLLCY